MNPTQHNNKNKKEAYTQHVYRSGTCRRPREEERKER
jgi:hypothetical protein